MDYYKKLEYWEKILGTNVKEIISEEEQFAPDAVFQDEYDILQEIYEKEVSNSEDWKDYCISGVFSNFYGIFGKIAVLYFKRKSQELLKNPEKTILTNLYQALLWIPLRVLIQDIHGLKEKGKLQGRNSREEYQDYQNRFLNSKVHIKSLCDHYLEMKRLIFIQIIYVVNEIWKVMEAYERDKDELCKEFFCGTNPGKIENIECGMSDVHNGQTVAVVYFDNKEKVIYKPRRLQKDKCFFQIYAHFCKQIELPLHRIKIIERAAYGWEEYVSVCECHEKEGIDRYFERMGVLLFLCYILDASDMHGENIIAFGEEPIPIDLETIPGYHIYKRKNTAEAMVQETVQHSVIKTGILPVKVWNDEGKGVILNAINNYKTIQTPFKIPVLCSKDSSDIHIEYRCIEKRMVNSLPTFGDMTINPVSYTKYLCNGFSKAYMLFLQKHKSLIPQLLPLFDERSRCLFRHTQQYHMYLLSSYYPEFLEDTDKRKLFLHVLDRNASNKKILQYERDSLFMSNIPAFYYQGNTKTVFTGQNVEYLNFLDCSPKINWVDNLDKFNLQDLEHQVFLIEYSLSLLDKRKYMHRKSEICVFKGGSGEYKEKIKEQITKIANKICHMAFVNSENDIDFCVFRPEKLGQDQFGTSGMYLYYGLAGIAVFLASALRNESCWIYEYIFNAIVQKMFKYTESVCDTTILPETKRVGAVAGESSMVAAYLILYKILKEQRYLNYAELHASIINELWQAETSMDYLTGLSGAVVVFGRMYRITKKEEYLNTAVLMGERIWKNCEITKNGAGWRIMKDILPLAGIAHGNSGLLMAYSELLELTGSAEYCKKIDLLLKYENSLIKNGNWIDLRHSEGKRLCNNAWCHGAAGILLARCNLKKAGYPDKYGLVERDVQYCKDIFLEFEEPEELCLCHGLCGNYMALSRYLDVYPDAQLEREKNELGMRIISQIKNKQIATYEKNNPSLMTGIAGIGVTLCRMNGLEI